MRINSCGHDHSTSMNMNKLFFKRITMKKTNILVIAGAVGVMSLVAISGVNASFDEGKIGEGGRHAMQERPEQGEKNKGSRKGEKGERKNISQGERMQHREHVNQNEDREKSQGRYEKRHMERDGVAHQNMNTQAREAVEMNNWEAFKAAVKAKFFGEKIDTESDFDKLQEARQLRADGEHDQARAIMKDLGLQKSADGQGRGPNK